MVQFRSTSLDVDQSNPINKDFENMIDNKELFGAFPEWFALENDSRSRTGNDTLPSMQLSDEELKGVDKLLGKFDMLFSADNRGFKQTHLTEYIIETVGNPIGKKPYPLPMVKMNWVHNEVEHLLKAGIRPPVRILKHYMKINFLTSTTVLHVCLWGKKHSKPIKAIEIYLNQFILYVYLLFSSIRNSLKLKIHFGSVWGAMSIY